MQQIRARLVILKVTALGLVYFAAGFVALERIQKDSGGSADNDDRHLVAVIALALAPFLAFFLDLMIEGASWAIKEIGYYVRTQVEPVLFDAKEFPAGFVPYERYLATPHGGDSWPFSWSNRLRARGNVLLTVLAAAISIVALWPGADVVGPGVELPGDWFKIFLPWAVVAGALAFYSFFGLAAPKEWTKV